MNGSTIVRMAIGDDAFDFTWSETLVAMIDSALAQARREGQEAMRERAARIAEGWKNPDDTNGHHECLVGQYVADDIRALPVE